MYWTYIKAVIWEYESWEYGSSTRKKLVACIACIDSLTTGTKPERTLSIYYWLHTKNYGTGITLARRMHRVYI